MFTFYNNCVCCQWVRLYVDRHASLNLGVSIDCELINDSQFTVNKTSPTVMLMCMIFVNFNFRSCH